MTQKVRILQLLEQRGELGVHSFEFYELHMPRGAAVIHALKKEGYAIESRHESHKGGAEGVRYFLRTDELVPVSSGSAPKRGGSQSSQYDPFGEWS